MHFWIVDEVITVDLVAKRAHRSQWRWTWILASTVFAAICFTSSFIPSHSRVHEHLRGWGYYGYIVGVSVAFSVVLFRTFIDSRSLAGSKRLELRVWLFGGCATALTIESAMLINALTGYHGYIRYQPIVVMILFAGTAYVITTHRIFDAGQALRIVLSRIILAGSVVGAAYCAYLLAIPFLPSSVAVLPAITVALISAPVLKGLLDRWFEFYPQAKVAREAAFDAAQTDMRLEHLEARFLDILRGWGQAEHALILTEEPTGKGGDDSASPGGGPVFRALRDVRWVTPERITRERSSPDAEVLSAFLTENRLGVAVFTGTRLIEIIVGVGVPATHRPFTYPHVTQLQELAAIMEGAFERKVLAMRIQHAEQLATVGVLGASLAHEIRNPLVSVKAIVQLLPSRYEEPAFREKFFRLISDEVVRIDRLTEQLLDLASPRVYTARPIDLHAVIRTALDLVSPRAAEKRVDLVLGLEAAPDRAFTDPAVVTQVLLNLCFNAIQALDLRPSGRSVRIETRNLDRMIELAVTDNGLGMSPQVRARLFRPFQTTKTTGFGLGLTVCRDILAALNANITADLPIPGRGATFRVTFPCPPSLS